MVIQKTSTSFSNHSSAISTSSCFSVSNEKSPEYCWDHNYLLEDMMATLRMMESSDPTLVLAISNRGLLYALVIIIHSCTHWSRTFLACITPTCPLLGACFAHHYSGNCSLIVYGNTTLSTYRIRVDTFRDNFCIINLVSNNFSW